MFFRNYRVIMYIIVGIYLVGIHLGQKWMENRPAFDMKIPLFLWNMSLTLFSILVTIRVFPELIYFVSQKDGIYRSVCMALPHNYATSFWLLICALSKIPELGVTAFIVLRKQKLITLHWFHHVATVALAWVGYESQDPVSRYIALNTFVHSFMYFYYALKALKIKIPKKFSRALTTLQIVQLLCGHYVLVSTITFLAQGRECRMNKNLIYLALVIVGVVTILFIRFYRQTYSRKNINAPKAD